MDQNCEQPVVGIRPGEKVHEEMITASDSFYTYDLGKVLYHYYLQQPNSWDLEDIVNQLLMLRKVEAGFSYNSGDNTEWETVLIL